MITTFLCLVALGVVAASAVYSTKALRKMDAAYLDRMGQD